MSANKHPLDTMDPSKLDALAQSIDTMEKNLHCRLQLEELCKSAYMSKFHFLRTFEQATGLSPIQYQNARIMTEASFRLKFEKNSVESIAYDLGYQDHSSFSRAFKRHFNLSPLQYRSSNDPLWHLHLAALNDEILDHWNTGGILCQHANHLKGQRIVGIEFELNYDGDFRAHYQMLLMAWQQVFDDLNKGPLWLFQSWDHDSQLRQVNRYFLGFENDKSFVKNPLQTLDLPPNCRYEFSHWGAKRTLLHHSFRFIFQRFDANLSKLQKGWIATRIDSGELSLDKFFCQAHLHLC